MLVSTNLKLQNVVSDWNDMYQNKRAHALVVLPAATSANNLCGVTLEEENSEVNFEFDWPADLSKVDRILTHSRYNNHYTRSHPKWIALQGSFDGAIGNKPCFKSKFKIKLPGKGYQFTPPDVSGHKSCIIFEQKSFRIDEQGNEIEVPAKATLFCLVDLFIPNENQQVGNAPTLEDDFSMD